MQRNMQLLKERAWFDIPIIYNNNRRAILAMEKGTPGEQVFERGVRDVEAVSGCVLSLLPRLIRHSILRLTNLQSATRGPSRA